jgi:hypothetical protein
MKAFPVILVALLGSAFAPATRAQPAADSPHDVEQVIVTAPKLSDEVKAQIHNFVGSLTMPSQVGGEVTRWDVHNPICPKTQGFTRDQDNEFVTFRIRQIAAQVGAPVAPPPCKTNIEVYFASSPQELLDGIRKHGGSFFLTSTLSQAKRVANFSHPIQAWYITSTRDICGTTRIDNEDNWWDGTIAPGCQPSTSFQTAVEGSRLRTGLNSELGLVSIVADVNQTAHYSFLAVADYIAMLALSQTQNFEACQPLPSIANLTSPDCDSAKKTGAITPIDLAFLTGIYKMDPGASLQTQRSTIDAQMESAMTGQ